MERGLRLPTQAAGLYVPGACVRRNRHAQAVTALGGGVGRQPAGTERAPARLAAGRMTPARRGTGGAIRGRTAIALGLATFLLVTTSVVWRRARGSAAAIRLHSLGARIGELEAQRARLDGDVRRALSRVELVPRVQRLGMTFPNDSQVIDLPVPVRR